MNLSEKIKQVNKILEDFGGKAIQVDTTKAFKSIGYKPQYLIDAMNEVFGVGGWFHDVVSVVEKDIELDNKTKKVVSVMMKVTIIEGDATFTTGQQFGGSMMVRGSYGDAFKSAVTDGLGKCLSLLGVGSRAYRGELVAPQDATVIEPTEADEAVAEEINTEAQGRSTANGGGKGFRPKAPTPEAVKEPAPANAPTARFRSSGLSAGFQTKASS